MEINSKTRKKKREIKRRKRGKNNDVNLVQNGKPKEVEEVTATQKKDTLQTTYANPGNENYVILLVKKAHPPRKDSVYVHTEANDTLTLQAQSGIKAILEANEFGKHDIIILKESIEYSNKELSGNSKQKEKVIVFLEKLGISRKQIRFKE